MNYRKWADRYSTDCSIKYNSKSTRDSYISCVKSFLIRFDKYNEPKEVPTYEIKEYLLELIMNIVRLKEILILQWVKMILQLILILIK